MKTQLLVLLSMAGCTSATVELTPAQVEAKRSLEETAQMEEYHGSIFVQARNFDGIDYRPILKQAIDLNDKALISLFTMNFMGEAAETHCAILKDLMILWGDDQFSEVVARQRGNIRDFVVGCIDYAWADPEWDLFPKTLANSPDSITKRTKAEQEGAGQSPTRPEFDGSP